MVPREIPPYCLPSPQYWWGPYGVKLPQLLMLMRYIWDMQHPL